MTLRGQGDAPVRICDPCKKLEDAARNVKGSVLSVSIPYFALSA